MARRRKKSTQPPVERFELTYLGPCAVFVLPDPSHDPDLTQTFPRGETRMVDKETLWRCTSDARRGLPARQRSRWSASPSPQQPEGAIVGIEEVAPLSESIPTPNGQEKES